MFSKKWWAKVAERMTKTAAGALTTLFGSDAVGWINMDAEDTLRSAAIMVLISFLSAIVTTPMGPDPQDPSAV